MSVTARVTKHIFCIVVGLLISVALGAFVLDRLGVGQLGTTLILHALLSAVLLITARNSFAVGYLLGPFAGFVLLLGSVVYEDANSAHHAQEAERAAQAREAQWRDDQFKEFTALWQKLWVAPPAERSTGEAILTLSHRSDSGLKSDVLLDTALFHPDSQTLVLWSPSRQPAHVDVNSGRTLGVFGEKPEQHDDNIIWSPDGKYVVRRSAGHKYKPNPYTTLADVRIRAFTRDDHSITADWHNTTRNCTGIYSGDGANLQFSRDGRSLWVLCDATNVTNRSDPIAIRLSFPELTEISRVAYGAVYDLGVGSAGGVVQTDRVATWHSFDATTIVIVDLATGEIGRHVTGLPRAVLRISSIGMDQSALRHCGLDFRPRSSCLEQTVDMVTGAVLSTRELDRSEVNGTFVKTTSGQQWLWAATEQEREKFSEIVLSGPTSKIEVQKLSAGAQRPLAQSPDRRWFVTQESESGLLRFYRVK
jgi:hypothetical protein